MRLRWRKLLAGGEMAKMAKSRENREMSAANGGISSGAMWRHQ
jgi:hypothetical protein